MLVVIMGQNCEKFIGMCLESVKTADKIIYCDGGSTDNTINLVYKACKVIGQTYDQEDKAMNGKQRNFYLNYLKENHVGEWCLVLDADEVVEDLDAIKKFTETIKDADEALYSVKMRHFIGDLGHEDSTVPEHFVPHRLFKVRPELSYPEVEHPVLQAFNETQSLGFRGTTIWHLAYCPNMWDIKRRYDSHMKKSNMHTPQFLRNWYWQHLFGQYPRTPINVVDIPKVILNEFGIDKDEIYFANRGLEVKHFLMASQWVEYFRREYHAYDYSPKVIEFGCGFGPYGVAVKTLGCEYEGIEISEFAVKTNPFGLNLKKGNIVDTNYSPRDLVLCIDVLEHLSDDELDKALDNILCPGSVYIFSIPFIGDPNLEADKTHKQFKTKQEWTDLLRKKGYKITEAPKEWYYANQILIGEPNG